ncbi:glycosyltransferase family 4 protein [Bizionia psychrotolerans]|uniref:glycosyltransferase family 4 protein n=1 Tax=Bizionia psychrotolerans TaxID=1492901 RepID=UPI000650BB00|nr:glycosyltransferase family 4 protein [Bizionia psychrotolerans]
MNKKRILIVSSEFPPQPGGIGNHAYYLALYLSKNNYDVTVIADQREAVNSEEIIFDAKLPFKVKRIPLQNPRFKMYLNRIRNTLTYFKQADCVIATGKFSLWNVALCSFFYDRKKMAVIHGSEVNFKSKGLRKSIDFSLKRFETIVAVSQYTKQLVDHIEREVTVIPNGIDLMDWQTEGLQKATLSGHPVLTTVGRVSSRKGQLQVIKLLPDLLKAYPNAHYHCVGIPTEAVEFMEEAKQLDVDAHVSFHGAVSESELKSILLGTDIFVMLSIEIETGDVEGFGIAILEANALGIPAIGSTNCGISDAIDSGVTGFLIDSLDAPAFSLHMKTLLENQHNFNKQAKNWAEQHDWNTIIKRYISLIS